MEYIRLIADVLSMATSLLFIWTMVKQKRGYVEDGSGSGSGSGSESESGSGSESGSESGSGSESESGSGSEYDSSEYDSDSGISLEFTSRKSSHTEYESSNESEDEFVGSAIAVKGNNTDDEIDTDTECPPIHPNIDLIDINSKIGVLLNSSVMWEDKGGRTSLFQYTELPRETISVSSEEEAPQLTRAEEVGNADISM